MKDAALHIAGLCKNFGRERAVNNVSLAVAKGEYLCLLGASGSGKTTLLRLVAGLEAPESGRITLFGNDITGAKPHERGIPLVFQQPSLWPHMNVLDQIAFGPKEHGSDSRTARGLASSYIERVGLSGLENRKPGQLSGGQQQRVALARCLVLGAKTVLLDEPLANLDASLKSGMRDLLRRLPGEFGVTVLHVTHDREDAFELADRVAILEKGTIAACGAPRELYRHPPSASIASLLGEINCIAGQILSFDSDVVVAETEFGLWRANHCVDGLARGNNAMLLFRPESMVAVAPDRMTLDQCNFISAEVTMRHFSGPLVITKLRSVNSARPRLFTRFTADETERLVSDNGLGTYHVTPSDVTATRDVQLHNHGEGLS